MKKILFNWIYEINVLIFSVIIWIDIKNEMWIIFFCLFIFLSLSISRLNWKMLNQIKLKKLNCIYESKFSWIQLTKTDMADFVEPVIIQ